jgi:8-oxo-dGTP diphosphatase
MSDSEQDFLASYDADDYDLPLTMVDMAIFSVVDMQMMVLLVKRSDHPAKGRWALPGGFIDINSDRNLDATARRKLAQKTGIDTPYLEQVATYGTAKRDPRGWSVTIAYMALLPGELLAEDGTETAVWTPVEVALKRRLAFDHREILADCIERLRGKVEYTDLPLNLMPTEFTLTELQRTYELILGKPMEKKSFRRRMLDADVIAETGNIRTGSNRPAKLYSALNRGSSHFFNRNLEGRR